MKLNAFIWVVKFGIVSLPLFDNVKVISYELKTDLTWTE